MSFLFFFRRGIILSPRPTHLERTRQIERGSFGRHGPEGAQARGGGRGRPPGGGTGQGGCGEHLGLLSTIVGSYRGLAAARLLLGCSHSRRRKVIDHGQTLIDRDQH